MVDEGGVLMVQTVFKRVELKYRITLAQKEKILQAMEPYMKIDKYGRTTIRNIYFDTDTYLLIRRSIEKPVYKEKLRIRSYGSGDVFVELKKKYKKIVYKRRVALPETDAMDWICGRQHCGINTQITAEIDYFIQYYKTLHPAVFLSYEREAYKTREKSDFRVTFDENILCRQEALSLHAPVYGERVLPEGEILMEIKCSGGLPLWMAQVLSQEKVFKTSFSKYGTVYKTLIFPKIKEELFHVSRAI